MTGSYTTAAGMTIPANANAMRTQSLYDGSAAGSTLRLNGNNALVGDLRSVLGSAGTAAGSAVIENGAATDATFYVEGGSTSNYFAGRLQDGSGGGRLGFTKNGSGIVFWGSVRIEVTGGSAGFLTLNSSGELHQTGDLSWRLVGLSATPEDESPSNRYEPGDLLPSWSSPLF